MLLEYIVGGGGQGIHMQIIRFIFVIALTVQIL